MPHKHKRRGEVDASQRDLPPTSRAKPLPTRDSGNLSENFASKTKQKKDRKKAKRIAGYGADDTPKAFLRLMQLGQTGKGFNGLDNGDAPRGKKRKTNEAQAAKTQKSEPAKPAAEMPKILPGERMSDFAARVDQAIPVAGLARKGKNIEGVKERQTKTEKRIQKMISDWRVEEAKIKEREEEEQELAEEEAEEQGVTWEDKNAPEQKSKKKGKRKRQIGEVDDKDDDPWAVLKAKRDEPKGINDIVQAPPTFNVIPKEKFKVKNGAKVRVDNIPNSAGSLRRREELGATRQSIIDSYREMMAAKKNAA
ncbi:uncharacterized protein K452DRAFT_255400 [Aplosporella prunicola CBS 121167]|uniref:Uncharacterized protein n=1 Tax=Aplosporella prunicola CBS 121167 TaxID=1176127 RepID=A0A6A6B5U5_9PEZI|nr:uncharacterized protein K452DRAFT_255400 [Aplosporella prunicola CBS 121167]KAF2138655.1 hypothetical protein K452DRAFT_255400 [Aplosporella prunicola CBS 121167]